MPDLTGMLNRTESGGPRAFDKVAASTNKTINFKELLLGIRSVLEGAKRPTPQAFCPEASDKAPEIPAEPAVQHAVAPVPVSVESGPPEIDPLELTLAPPMTGTVPTSGGLGVGTSDGKPTGVTPTLETALVENVVRSVVWGGDRRRGVARLELDGDYAGTTIWVRGEGRSLEVEISLGSRPESTALPARLLERLRARGLDVAAVEVR